MARKYGDREVKLRAVLASIDGGACTYGRILRDTGISLELLKKLVAEQVAAGVLVTQTVTADMQFCDRRMNAARVLIHRAGCEGAPEEVESLGQRVFDRIWEKPRRYDVNTLATELNVPAHVVQHILDPMIEANEIRNLNRRDSTGRVLEDTYEVVYCRAGAAGSTGTHTRR